MNHMVLGYDVRLPYPSEFFGRKYAGVDDAGWDWPEGYDGKSYKGDVSRNRYLWCSLSDLMEFVASSELNHTSIIAVCLDSSDVARLQVTYLDPSLAEPKTTKRSWKFLGFDVANQYLQSTLVSFGGLMPDKAGEMSDTSGLFVSYESAGIARDYAEANSPEDGPFFVFGVYLIPT